jgi:hypothetical protein
MQASRSNAHVSVPGGISHLRNRPFLAYELAPSPMDRQPVERINTQDFARGSKPLAQRMAREGAAIGRRLPRH